MLHRLYEYKAALGAILCRRSRLVNFIKSNFERNKDVLHSMPYVLHIEPAGNLCNLRCPLCPVGNFELDREKGLMKFEVFEEIVNQMDDSVFYIIFSGWGEPLVNKDLFRMIRLARERKIFCKMFTNATYLTAENIRALLESGINVIRCSYDGIAAESYLKYRVGGDYNAIMKNFDNLKKIKEELKSDVLVELQFVVMKHNYHEIKEFKKLAKSFGFVPLIKNAFITHTDQAEEWLPDDEKYRRYGKDIAEKAELEAKKFDFCHAPWQNLFILWNGEVTACCAKAKPAYMFGKTSQNIKEYWNSAPYQALRKGMLSNNRRNIGYCKGCSTAQERFLL